MSPLQPEVEALRTVTLFVDELVVALVNVRIYQPGHPRIQETVHELAKLQAQLGHLLKGAPLQLAVANRHILFDGRPLRSASLSASRLMGPIAERGSGGVQFDADTTEDELQTFLGLLAGRVEKGDNPDRCNQALATNGCRGIRLLPPYKPLAGTDETADGKGFESDPETEHAIALYQGVTELLQGMTISVSIGKSLDFAAPQSMMERILHAMHRDPLALLRTARYERYDAYTFGHSIRVAILAVEFARELGFPDDVVLRSGCAALLHDIGKALVPFEIIHSQTRLTGEQRHEMEKHPALGARILLDHRASDPMAVAAAFGHHQQIGGGGYPETVESYRQSIVTKIVKICDVFEALTAVRPYKDAMSPTRAYRIMLSMRNHFDLGLLRKFIELNGVYPAGSIVQLNTGDRVRVRRQSQSIRLPVVEFAADAEFAAGAGDRVVDLSDPEFGGGIWVRGMVTDEGLAAA